MLLVLAFRILIKVPGYQPIIIIIIITIIIIIIITTPLVECLRQYLSLQTSRRGSYAV
jgi:hypothetical protein